MSSQTPFKEWLTSSANVGTSFSSPLFDKGTVPTMISTGRDGDPPKLTQNGENPVDSWSDVR